LPNLLYRRLPNLRCFRVDAARFCQDSGIPAWLALLYTRAAAGSEVVFCPVSFRLPE